MYIYITTLTFEPNKLNRNEYSNALSKDSSYL